MHSTYLIVRDTAMKDSTTIHLRMVYQQLLLSILVMCVGVHINKETLYSLIVLFFSC